MSAPAPSPSLPPTPRPGQPLQPLNYAATGGPAVDITPAHLSVVRHLIVLAVLSQACVAVCLLTLTRMDHIPTIGFVHLCVFATTIAYAIYTGRLLLLSGFTEQRSLRIHLPPLVGLAIIGVAPVLYQMCVDPSAFSPSAPLKVALTLLVALAFGLLSGFSFRHLALYRYLASWLNPTRLGLHGELRSLGVFKAFFETLWLACCSVTCLAPVAPFAGNLFLLTGVGALFGLGIYVAIWVVTLILHARLLAAIRQAT